MKNNKYFLLIIAFNLIILSCNDDDDSFMNINEPINNTVMGCTNTDAANYNPNATEDDGSCIVLGCVDPAATNFNSEATNDDGSCEYSTSYLLNGEWMIVSLEYSTEIDLSFLEQIIGFNPGNQELSGEANDAGVWTFQYPEYLYSNNLNFNTETITIIAFDIPSIPIDVSSNGTWELVNNDTNLLTTDDLTGVSSTYNILSIQTDMIFMNGIIPFSQEIMGFDVDLQIEVEMQLQKQ
ncbi:MAG: hypothetical protein CMD27_04310 [Flavobacteriales bacterium]|nr:hypothetical protein [Flavobacteriales bacterium]